MSLPLRASIRVRIAGMILSMTAFAKFESPSLTWEIRSVNNRYLEVDFRLPPGLRDVEPALRTCLRGAVARGKVDVRLRLTKSVAQAMPEIDREHLLALFGVLQQVRDAAPGTPGTAQPDPLEVLRWPGVVAPEPESANQALKTEARSGFEQAVERLVEHRCTEGRKLDLLLREKLVALESMVGDIRSLAASFAPMLRDRLLGRLRDLETAHVDSGRLGQEVALLAQKADIAEELDRLDIHAQACRDCLAAGGPQGRRLDFLMQELSREANTLAAKAITAECARRSVDLKVVIDQMREQVQNVE